MLIGCFADDPERDAKIELVGEVFGAAAAGYATELVQPKAIVLHGATAGNGKSQVLDAMRGLLPPSAISTLPPAKFADDRFVVQLVGALLNASDELSGSRAIGSDAFKAIVTGEPIMARAVYSPAATFRSRALNVFATNTLPSFTGGFDNGVQRRLLVLAFTRTIPLDERIEHIGQRIAAEEPDLLLAFAVDGACRLIRRRKFIEPPSSKLGLNQWIHGADPVLAWLADGTALAPDQVTTVAAALSAFNLWTNREGYARDKLPAANVFAQRVLAARPEVETKRLAKGRCFIGLGLIDSAVFEQVA